MTSSSRTLHADMFRFSQAVVPVKLGEVSGCPDVTYACNCSISACRRKGKTGGCATVTKLEVHWGNILDCKCCKAIVR